MVGTHIRFAPATFLRGGVERKDHMSVDIRDLIKHVGCGDLDNFGECDRCDEIREILGKYVPKTIPKKSKFRQHSRSCPAYGNYQPPYEECDCGAEDA